MHAVRKRLECSIKCRRNSRLSIFDSIRNFSVDSPKKRAKLQDKVEHRRMQLEKWKEDKEKKKKQAAAMKKKPFLTGVPHAPLKFELPPPPPRAVPSTCGRVTRSQSVKNNIAKPKPAKATPKNSKAQSFAPKDATFKPPAIKNATKVPTLAPQLKLIKHKETVITFDPVIPNTSKVNLKTKLNILPKITETKGVKPKVINKHTNEGKSKLTNKTINQVDKRATRGRLVKTTSSSSDQSQHSSEDTVSSERPTLRSKTHQKSTKRTKTPQKPTPRVSIDVPAQPLRIINTPPTSIQTKKMVTPKNPVPKSESSSEEKLRSPKSPVDAPRTPEQIVEEATKNSPFVTMSRGKANARRETLKKIDEGLMDEDASDVDSVVHFRRQLDSEIKHMTEMCDTWDRISKQIVLPEAVQEAVLGAVGQARLLMSHKLQQFASLVERCERPEPGRALVTPADLHGFWDMVFMQVENVYMRFKKLEEMRARNWAEEAQVAPRKRVPPPLRARTAAKPAASSRIKDMIMAARKAKKQDVQKERSAESSSAAAEPDRTFDAGFFCVRSPVRRSPAAAGASPARNTSLLKAVLSNEANKSATKNSTSLAMLRASLIGKSAGNDSILDEPLEPPTPVNLHATPARSILKPHNTASVHKSGKKSIKIVLFDDSDAEERNASPAQLNDDIKGVQKLEDGNTDSGLSSMDIEKEGQKENKPRKKSLVRQDATDGSSPVMTRSRRKSMPTASLASEDVEKTPKRSSRRKKTLKEVEVNVTEEKNHTPKRSSRRRSAVQVVE